MCAQAERVQQYQEMVAQQSQAVVAKARINRAESNVAVLAEQLSTTQDAQPQHARCSCPSRHMHFCLHRIKLILSIVALSCVA